MALHDWELISHIVQHNDLRSALARKVTPEMMGSDMAGRAFEFITQHHRKYRKIPGLALLTKKFPKGKFTLTADEPASYYLDNTIRQYLRAHGAELLMEAAQNIQDDPMVVMEQLRGEASALLGRSAPTTDVPWTQNWRERWRSYKRRKTGELLGIPTPWETWNQIAFGYQPEEYIIVSARPGVGKTFFVLQIGVHTMRLGKKVLFFTKEMSIEAVERRSDAMQFGLPYNAFRRGTLSPAEEKRYRRGLKRQARQQREGELGEIIFVSDAHLTVSAIEAKIEEYMPDLVIIDGLYLVTDLTTKGEQWVRLGNVSRETKALGQSYKVPIIATSQIHRMPGNLETNWRNLTLGDLAFSDALGQDADQVWALVKTETMRMNNQLMVKCLKMREEDLRDFGVSWNLGTMQETFHEIPITEEGDLDEQQDRDSETGEEIPVDDEVLTDAGGWDTPTREEAPDDKKRKKRKKRKKTPPAAAPDYTDPFA